MKPNRCIREWNGTLLEIRPLFALDLHRHEIWVSPTDADVVHIATASKVRVNRLLVNKALSGIYISGKEL